MKDHAGPDTMPAVKLLESTAGLVRLEFRLDLDWLRQRRLLPETYPVAENAPARLAAAMLQAAEAWCDQAGYARWGEPRCELRAQEAACLHFVAEVPALLPPALPPLAELAIELPEPEAEPGLLETVARLQQELAEAQSVPGPAEWGMRLRVDAVGFVAGVPIPDSAVSQAEWLLTPELMFPGFAKQLLGLRAQQSKELAITLPQDYPIAVWAGQKAVYKVKVLELERLRLPRLDDQLARLAGRGQTLRELEASLQSELDAAARANWSRQILASVFADLAEACELELPDQLIDTQMTRLWESTLVPALSARGVTPQQRQKALPFWLQHQLYRQNCEKQSRTGLLLKMLIDHFGLSLTDQELADYLAPLGKPYGLDAAGARAQLADQGRLEQLVQDLLRQKAEAALLAQVQLLQGGEPVSGKR